MYICYTIHRPNSITYILPKHRDIGVSSEFGSPDARLRLVTNVILRRVKAQVTADLLELPLGQVPTRRPLSRPARRGFLSTAVWVVSGSVIPQRCAERLAGCDERGAGGIELYHATALVRVALVPCKDLYSQAIGQNPPLNHVTLQR